MDMKTDQKSDFGMVSCWNQAGAYSLSYVEPEVSLWQVRGSCQFMGEEGTSPWHIAVLVNSATGFEPKAIQDAVLSAARNHKWERFEIAEPSLDDIFIDAIGAAVDADGAAPVDGQTAGERDDA